MPIVLTQDSNGWSIPVLAGDRKKVFCDFTKADDTGDGLTMANAKKNISGASSAISIMDPSDHLILKENVTWTANILMDTLPLGRSNTDPTVVMTENWDVDGAAAGRAHLQEDQSIFDPASDMSNIALFGIERSQPSFDGTSTHNSVLPAVDVQMENFLWEDCYFHDGGHMNIGNSGTSDETKHFDWEIRRCSMAENYDTTTHQQNIFIVHADTILLYESVLFRGGWHSLNEGRDSRSRNIYCTIWTGDAIECDRSAFLDGSSAEQLRAGGTFTNCLIDHEPRTLNMGYQDDDLAKNNDAAREGGFSAVCEDNVMIDAVDIDPDNPRGQELHFAQIGFGKSASIKRNLVARDDLSTASWRGLIPANSDTTTTNEDVIKNGLHDVTVDANVFWHLVRDTANFDFDGGRVTGTCPAAGQTTTNVRLENLAAHSSTDDFYSSPENLQLKITAGTNSGQTVTITDYAGTNKDCTVTPALPGACDGTSVYEIRLSHVDGIVVSNNIFGGYDASIAHDMVQQTGDFGSEAITYTDNQYYHEDKVQTDTELFEYNGAAQAFAAWVTSTGETGTWGNPSFTDDTRSISSYYTDELGQTTTGSAEGTKATGTFTLVSVVATDTVTVYGKVYTAVSGAKADNTEFDISGTDTAAATDLADSILQDSRHPHRATSSTNVVTVEAQEGAGDDGNTIDISQTGGNVTVSGATLSGGADGDRHKMYDLMVANRRATWNTAYTAPVINDWIRAGFDMAALETCTCTHTGEDAVLRNSGDYVLRNDCCRILRNESDVAVVTPEKSISHVTIDAGVDLRKKSKERIIQKLKLSIEIPIQGYYTQIQKVSFECGGTCKSRQEVSVFQSIPLVLKDKSLRIPMSMPVFSIQKSLFSIVGEKGYNLVMRESILKQKKKDEIDTLKEALRMLDEE